MTSVDDTEARRAIADSLDETLVVEAAAGTGKTTELVKRIVRVLGTGRATMVQIVAVTFTERAAGELKLRLREALEHARASAVEAAVRRRLEDALETLEEAHVNTIHGFCAELLRERPVEASVDPLFLVSSEAEADRYYARAFRAWLQEALKNPPDGLRRALRRTASAAFQDSSDSGPIDRIRAAGRTLAEWRDFPHPWRRPSFDRVAEIERLVSAVHQFNQLTSEPLSRRDNFFYDTDAVRRLSRQIQLEQSFGQVDYDGWEGRLIDLTRDRGFSRTRKGSGYRYGANRTRTEVLAARDQLLADLQRFAFDADADLAACLQQELGDATARYQALKASAGALDYADLLTRARDLLKFNIDVRRHLQTKFTRLFIDEFQDTDPVQAEILLLVAADDPTVDDWRLARPTPGKLFIVGDPKQAIYRFRGTDVGTYWSVSRQLERHGGRVVQLTTSYRSVPPLQQFVNAAFERVMVADEATEQASYAPLSRYRPADDSQPAIVALPVPRPFSGRGFKPSGRSIDESLPDAVGAFIAWLVDPKHGWTVGERGADGLEIRVPLQPRHVAVLFRRFTSFGQDVTRPYVNAIEARGVAHLLVGGKAFHEREEVETVRAALAAIEWPDDELSVFATLKGSLFAIDDGHLLEYRHRFGALHPFRVPKELGGRSGNELALSGEPVSHLVPIADALRLLQELHRGRNARPAADTIGRLLAETRAHVGFILRPAGEQALANVLHVAELARLYETGGGISFRGFIDELGAAAASETAEAPILEETSDGVRLMTVHKAKGLEFPVVILADLTCRLSRNDASRHVDSKQRLCAVKIGGWAPHDLHDHGAAEVARDEAEGVRLAYVAATRARDLLVVPALGDEPWEGGWLGPLNAALYPPLATRRNASRGAKCPLFKSKDSVLERPNGEPAGATTVCPGQHDFAEGYRVVWWDPGALSLDLAPPFGVRREDLIVKDVPRNVVADGRSRYDRWRVARTAAKAAGATPSSAIATVREHAITASGLNVASVEIVDLTAEGRSGDLAGGVAFGSLVHGVLAGVPFDASLDAIENVARLEARVLAIGPDETGAAVRAVERLLRHDILRRASAAEERGRCRRETPITRRLPDGTLVEGVVDLAFEENGAWVVVDYKTDRELRSAGVEQYRRQVAIYAEAIADATGAPARAVLVRV